MSAFCPPAPALAVSLSPAHAPSPVSASTASFRKKLPLLRCPCYPLVPRSPAHAPSPISIPLLLRHAIFPTSNLQPFSRSLPPSRSLSAAFSLSRSCGLACVASFHEKLPLLRSPALLPLSLVPFLTPSSSPFLASTCAASFHEKLPCPSLPSFRWKLSARQPVPAAASFSFSSELPVETLRSARQETRNPITRAFLLLPLEASRGRLSSVSKNCFTTLVVPHRWKILVAAEHFGCKDSTGISTLFHASLPRCIFPPLSPQENFVFTANFFVAYATNSLH